MRIPQAIKNMLRPKDFYPSKGFLFNSGYWIVKLEYTLLRIYKCRQPLHKLPLFVLECGFFEIHLVDDVGRKGYSPTQKEGQCISSFY